MVCMAFKKVIQTGSEDGRLISRMVIAHKLVFITTIANLVAIQYSLLIDKIPALNSVFNTGIICSYFNRRIRASQNDYRILA